MSDDKPALAPREYTAQDFLGEAVSVSYTPSSSGFGFDLLARLPPFNQRSIAVMVQDPTVCIGMGVVKGTIVSNCKIDCVSSREDVKQFVMDQYDRFFLNSAMRMLTSTEWGYSCSEVIYRQDKEQPNQADNSRPFLTFDICKSFDARDCRPQILRGNVIGARVRPTMTYGGLSSEEFYLGMPRVMWHVYNREINPWFGRSRLRGAYPPFMKKWGEGGYTDTELLYFKKYAFPGLMVFLNAMGNMPGQSTGEIGPERSYIDKIRNAVDKLRTGGNLTIPRWRDSAGNPNVEIEAVPMGANPAPMLEWGDRIDKEILKGLLVPPEVLEAQVSGLGQGGRSVAMTGFLVTLQDPMNSLAYDFDSYVVRPLVEWNFGPDVQYDVIPFKISEEGKGDPADPNAAPGINPEEDTADGAPPTGEEGDPAAQPPEQDPSNPAVMSTILPGGYIRETKINRDAHGNILGTTETTTRVTRNRKHA